MRLPDDPVTRTGMQALLEGARINCGSVTLATGADSTTVSGLALPIGALVFLFPQTVNAAAEFVAGTLRVAPVTTAGEFTITHVNSATGSRTFSWFAVYSA